MMQRLVDASGCNTTDLNSNDTISCLRQLDYDTISQASFDTYDSDEVDTNQGDSWMPVVDDDFLPAPPSQLLAENRFANVTAMALWMENDMQLYTPTDISSEQDIFDFYRAFLPGFTDQSITDMIALYPSADFQENSAANLSSQFYRSAQIFRDLLMTYPPIHFGENLARAGNVVYYISQNASLLPAMLAVAGEPGLEVVHTSEFPYTFGNLSHYNQSGFPFEPTAIDYRLEKEQAGSWAAFTYVGQPSLYTKKTLQGFGPAYSEANQTAIFIAGANEGLSNIDGEGASPALAFQHLRARCGFFNSASIIQQLQY
ncbi:hypothetical protein MRB53_040924 [Persea americana]|nr:hypothetical protein MRB53_040924 [Persea americana]